MQCLSCGVRYRVLHGQPRERPCVHYLIHRFSLSSLYTVVRGPLCSPPISVDCFVSSKHIPGHKLTLYFSFLLLHSLGSFPVHQPLLLCAGVIFLFFSPPLSLLSFLSPIPSSLPPLSLLSLLPPSLPPLISIHHYREKALPSLEIRLPLLLCKRDGQGAQRMLHSRRIPVRIHT